MIYINVSFFESILVRKYGSTSIDGELLIALLKVYDVGTRQVLRRTGGGTKGE
ncbi:hypothetical protein ACM26V_10220 [Salipaludibacillus sp. HK11]|uniref:hypothetical protein n=1 Tax=Salipaludibacillus sp. HK11 TaxID=3394320 RepID=UPI0039FC2534